MSLFAKLKAPSKPEPLAPLPHYRDLLAAAGWSFTSLLMPPVIYECSHPDLGRMLLGELDVDPAALPFEALTTTAASYDCPVLLLAPLGAPTPLAQPGLDSAVYLLRQDELGLIPATLQLLYQARLLAAAPAETPDLADDLAASDARPELAAAPVESPAPEPAFVTPESVVKQLFEVMLGRSPADKDVVFYSEMMQKLGGDVGVGRLARVLTGSAEFRRIHIESLAAAGS